MHALQFPGCVPWPMAQGYGHGERIFDIAFHPFSEDIVLTASEDTSVRMWRRPDGSSTYKQVRAFLGHTSEALRTCWSANGLLLASGSADRTVRLWATDLEDPGYTGRQLAVLDGHPEEVYHVEFVDPTSPPTCTAAVRQGTGDGPPPPLPPFESHVLVCSSESLFVWSLREGAVVQQADAPGTSGSTITQDAIMAGSRPAYIFGVSRQPGGSLLAAACSDGVVRLWSLRPTGHLEWAGQMALPGQPMCTGCAFAADGMRLGVTTREGQLVELDFRTMELLTSRQLPSSSLTIAYMPAGTAAAAGGTAGAIGAQPPPARQAAARQQQPELWLVACQDGAVYGYGLEQRGGGPACVIRPPSGADVPMLAVAVAGGGCAVAVGGEPQDTSRLPPIRQQPPVAAAAIMAADARPTGPQQPTATATAAATADAEPASYPSAIPSTSVAICNSHAALEGPAAAAAAAVAAPRRRGGRGARMGPAAAAADGGGGGGGEGGGCDALGLLTAAEEEEAGELLPAPRSQQQRQDQLSGRLAAMALGGRAECAASGQQQLLQGDDRQQPQGGPAPQQGQQGQQGQGQDADRGGQDVKMGDSSPHPIPIRHQGGRQVAQQEPQAQGQEQQQGGSGPVAAPPSGRVRAPLFVYLGTEGW